LLDNAFVQLVQETGKRLLTKSFLEAFCAEFDRAVKHELYTGWGNPKDDLQKLIGDKVKEAIKLYAQEKVQEVVNSLNDELIMEARGRMDIVKKLSNLKCY
jgi:hypothetical protein